VKAEIENKIENGNSKIRSGVGPGEPGVGRAPGGADGWARYRGPNLKMRREIC